MRQVRAEVIGNDELAPGTRLLRLRAPDIANCAMPGQFVHVRCGQQSDPLLRRPISLARVADQGHDEVALLVDVVGRGSAMLAESSAGRHLDMLGPLGRGFTLDHNSRQLLLVAGGVGIAPLLALAAQALDKDLAVTILFGARDRGRVFPSGLIPPQVEYVVLTEDGSFGRQGLVTAALPDYWDTADQIFSCGPPAMLSAVARLLRERVERLPGSYAQVSLEQHMGCAMGACYGCVIETASGHRRVCRDGPVFELSSLRWW